jgi:hypothetical protein
MRFSIVVVGVPRPVARLIPLTGCRDGNQHHAADGSGITGWCIDTLYPRIEFEQFCRCSVPILGVALLVAALLLGCTNARARRPTAMLPAAAFVIPQRYLIITLPNPVNSVPTHPASSPRGYDNVGPYAAGTESQRASRAIAASYRLREVSSWPIAVLGVNCIVYELPADADLARTLAALASDARVKSAQPLFDFAIELDH